jgi:uncharacterized protein YkwD
MRRSTLYACTAALALAALVSPAVALDLSGVPAFTAGQSRVERMVALEEQLLAAINVVRGQHGRRPFRASRQLRAAAFAHSEQMVRLGYFQHASAGGTPFWRRIMRFYPMRGYRDWAVAENIAEGSPGLTASEALGEWLRSPPHRANVLSRAYRDAGVGAVFSTSAPGFFGGAPTIVVTLDVGRRRR